MSEAPQLDAFGRHVEIECFMLADAAEQEDSKLNVRGGGLDFVRASSFPASLPLALVIRLRAPWSYGKSAVPIALDLRDADGRPVQPFPIEDSLDLRVAERGEEHDDLPVATAIQFTDRLAIPAPGLYSFYLLIEGAEAARIPFRVMRA